MDISQADITDRKTFRRKYQRGKRNKSGTVLYDERKSSHSERMNQRMNASVQNRNEPTLTSHLQDLRALRVV